MLNGTESVALTNADESKVSAPIVNNAYIIMDATNNAESLQITSANGANTYVGKLPQQ